MNIRDVYEKYQLPQSLRRHMLYTGGVAQIITENWTGLAINKRLTVIASLLHDIAKPLKFDLSKQAAFGTTPSELTTIIEFQTSMKAKYGDDEFAVLNAMLQELGADPVLINNLLHSDWPMLPDLLETQQNEALIEIYADMRISKDGILPLRERVFELRSRTTGKDYDGYLVNGTSLEKMIQQNVSTDLSSITNELLSSLFDKLLKFEIN